MTSTKRFPIADMHCDTVMHIQRGFDISKRNEKHHIDLPRLKEGGITVQVFASTSVYADETRSHSDNVNRQIDLLYSEFERNSDTIEICLNSEDISRANAEGKIAAILSIEGGQALDSDPANIERFYRKGIRLITLTHELPLGWCAYHKEPDADTRGLNETGKEIIAEMNRLGMIIDISHSGDQTVRDVLDTSSSPVIASHSNARALCNHSRNLPNELIKAIAESGGLTGITFVNNFISEKFDKAYEAFWSTVPEDTKQELKNLYSKEMPEGEYRSALERDFKFILDGEKSYRHHKPGIPEIIDHLDYIVNIAGIDHVGIGSDFDGISSTPDGLDDCSKMQSLIQELHLRKYSDDDINKISSANFLRVFKSVCG